MKKNFLVTTGLVDTWEFNENNYLLGKWCEFHEETMNEIPKETSIIRNADHWNSNEKRIKDYEYIKKTLKYLLEIISEKLCIIHNVTEDKEYWRVVIYGWLSQYTPAIFNKWESVRIFFEKNKINKFYTNFISLNDADYIPKNHVDYHKISIHDDEWNHLVFLRLFHFLNIQNLSLVEKRIDKNNLKKAEFSLISSSALDANSENLFTQLLQASDKIISKHAFKYNKIILDTFYFPKKEFLKICLRCKLIPCKYINFFNFNVKEESLSKEDKRVKLKNLLLKVDIKDKFIQFLLSNLHKDIPKSYLENFDTIKKKILPFAKKKKIIFSMHSICDNDNFKIYIAETKKVGSKYIYVIHGGGLTFKLDIRFNFFEKVSNKIIRWAKSWSVNWDDAEQNQDIYADLSPTLPTIKLKDLKIGTDCTIVSCEPRKHVHHFRQGPTLEQEIDFFNELMQFIDKLNPEIQSKVKFRVKENVGNNYAKKFSRIFGEKKIDKVSTNNPISKTLLNSKLIINTYAQTTFCEAMQANIPTILIIKKNHWNFTKTALDTFEVLKKNHIAFDNFDEAKNHINKHWKELRAWWYTENVQFARKTYLSNFYNVKTDWHKEWSDYIYFSKQL